MVGDKNGRCKLTDFGCCEKASKVKYPVNSTPELYAFLFHGSICRLAKLQSRNEWDSGLQKRLRRPISIVWHVSFMNA